MTKVTFYKKNNLYIGFKVEGHSGFSEAGSDIVCSAISTASQMTVVALKEVLNIKIDLIKREYEAFLKCKLAKSISEEEITIAQSCFKTLMICLEDIEKEYKKYLKLEVKDEIY